jgi:hypothetical protein
VAKPLVRHEALHISGEQRPLALVHTLADLPTSNGLDAVEVPAGIQGNANTYCTRRRDDALPLSTSFSQRALAREADLFNDDLLPRGAKLDQAPSNLI